MNKFVFIVLFLLCNKAFGQIVVSPKDTTICKNTNITLTANLSSSFPGNISLDDIFGGVVDMGFDFVFYGKTYNKCVISANNFISFNLNRANTASHYIYNNAAVSNQLDTVIMFPFQDINPNVTPNGGIQYVTVGSPGNRRFIVQFCDMALYNCNSLRVTNQLILYETTNRIEIHTTLKPTGCGWQSGTGVMGLRSGSLSNYVTGRNAPNVGWAASNEGIRFTPNGNNNYTISTIPFSPVPIIITQNNPIQWFRQGSATPIGTGNTINVTPDGSINYYVARYQGTGVCNSNSNFTLMDTVFIYYDYKTDTVTATVCQGDSFNFYGRSIGVAGWYDTVITNNTGCDSMIYLNLTVNPSYTAQIYDTVCQGELPYSFGGQNIYSAGTHYDTLATVLNCDSVIQLHLTVLGVQSDTFTVSICQGQTYTYNNVNYTSSGYYPHVFVDSRGCDSVMVLHLLVDNYIITNVYDTFCHGDYYVLPLGDTAYVSGTYYDTILYANTCDSVFITHLYRRDSIGAIVYDSVCSDELPIIWNGITVNSGGTNAALYTTSSQFGCDSFITLHLTVHNVYTIIINDSICTNNLPYTFGGNNYSSSGTYNFNHQSIYGCDSNIQLNLTVLPHHRDTFTVTICQGQSYTYNNISYNSAGFYTHTFARTNGCDSIRVLDLKLDTVFIQQVYDTICFGINYILPGNTVVNQSGVYSDTFSSSSVCDSIIITHLYVRDSSAATVNFSECSNRLPFVWNGINVTTSGNGVATYTTNNMYGCDSTTTLNLTVNSIDSVELFDTTCFNALPYNFLGTLINTAGQYRDTLPNMYGCDSIIKLHLTVNNYHTDTTTATICPGDSFYFDGSYYTNAGIVTHSYTNQFGCDSFMVLNLIVNPVTPVPVVNSPIAYCQNDIPGALTAIGTGLLWYANSIGGTGSTNAPTPVTTAIDTQKYYVTQTLNGCESQKAEVIVYIREKLKPDFNFFSKEVCQYNIFKVTYTGPAVNSNFLHWNWDGGILDSVVGNDYYVHWNSYGTKNISLYINNMGCISDTATDMLNVKPTPLVNSLELKDYACIGDTITISAGTSNNDATFLWTINGLTVNETTNSFKYVWQAEGWKKIGVRAQIEYCFVLEKHDSIYISGYPKAKIIPPENTPVCFDELLIFSVEGHNSAYTYEWNPQYYIIGDNNKYSVNARLNKSDSIYLKVINNYECISYDKVYVEGIYCCDLGVPNAFSPNGDGLNDRFGVVAQATQGEFLLRIFDRWGKMVFFGDNINNSWDGYINGKPADVGTYYYHIIFTCINGEKTIKKGDLILIR